MKTPADKPLHQDLSKRNCPLCGSVRLGEIWAPARLPEQGWSSLDFASRKFPDSFHWEYARCAECSLVYAPLIPNEAEIQKKYRSARHEDSSGHRDAAQDYFKLVMRFHDPSTARSLVDLGAGDGSFLLAMKTHGWTDLLGIEPSRASIEHADSTIRPHLTREFPNGMERSDGGTSWVTCFQTLEHLRDPVAGLVQLRTLLAPHGRIAVVCHDVEGWVQTLLGARSPLLDIEHFQLFSVSTLRSLLVRSGYTDIEVGRFSNSHSLAHWLKLSPLPIPLKKRLTSALDTHRWRGLKVQVPAVNLFAVGRKAPSKSFGRLPVA